MDMQRTLQHVTVSSCAAAAAAAQLQSLKELYFGGFRTAGVGFPRSHVFFGTVADSLGFFPHAV